MWEENMAPGHDHDGRAPPARFLRALRPTSREHTSPSLTSTPAHLSRAHRPISVSLAAGASAPAEKWNGMRCGVWGRGERRLDLLIWMEPMGHARWTSRRALKIRVRCTGQLRMEVGLGASSPDGEGSAWESEEIWKTRGLGTLSRAACSLGQRRLRTWPEGQGKCAARLPSRRESASTRMHMVTANSATGTRGPQGWETQMSLFLNVMLVAFSMGFSSNSRHLLKWDISNFKTKILIVSLEKHSQFATECPRNREKSVCAGQRNKAETQTKENNPWNELLKLKY